MANGWHLVEDGGRRRRVAIAHDGGTTWVFVDGNVWTIESASSPRRAGRSRAQSDVSAPMPATVVAINAVAGKHVNEGDAVIVLEAMKMELPIRAPRSGIVKAIHCTKGELVQPGVNLIEIDSSTEAQGAKVE